MAAVDSTGNPPLEYDTPPLARSPATRVFVEQKAQEILDALGGMPGPFTLVGSVSPGGNAILRWDQSANSAHYKVFKDGVAGADLGDVHSVDHDAGALAVDVPTRFYVRAWVADPDTYRDTAEVTLTRVGLVGPSIIHHVSGTTPESGTEPSLTPSLGPALVFTRATPAMGVYHNGEWRRVAAGQPFFADIVRAENLFANSDAPATQTITGLMCGQYRVEVWGTGSVTLTGTASSVGPVTEAGGSQVFDHYAQNTDFDTVTVTVSGTLTKFQLTAGTEAHQYVASGPARLSYTAGRGRMRLFGPETPLGNFPYGSKGATTWDNLALADRSMSTSRGPWTARMYEFKENTATGIHGSRYTLSPALPAGTYQLLVYLSADVSGDRSIALGILDSGGTSWAFINPTTGVINATPVDGTPIITGYSCTRQADGGYLITWTHAGSQSIGFRNYHLNGANATTIAALTFAGSTAAKTRSIGWFLKSGSTWLAPQLYADGARAQEYGTYTLTDQFDTAGSTIRWRGLFAPGQGAANRTICAGGNMVLRRNSAGRIELVVGAMTLTHGSVIADGVGVSVAVRIKAGDYGIAVDSAQAVDSSNAAAPSAITTLYRGVDSGLANPSHEEWSLFELHRDAHDDATLEGWTASQGTGGAGTTQRFSPPLHGGMYVRVGKQWSTQTKSGSVYSYGTTGLAQLQAIKARNGGNGFAGMAGVLLVFPWSAIQPKATTWTWTDLDACMDWLEAEGLACFIMAHDRNYWRAGVTCPPHVQTITDPTLAVYDSAALHLPAVMEQKRVLVDAIANHYRNRAHFLGCIEPETALASLNQLGAKAKKAHWDNLITLRAALCAAYPELVFGNYINGMNLVVSYFKAQANASIGYGNCLWGWPDSVPAEMYQDPVANNYYYAYQIARDPAYNQKMVIFPGVQHDIAGGGNYDSYNTLLRYMIDTEKAHCICMEPELTGYSTFWEDVVLRLAGELTFNQDNPWTSVVET